MTCLYCSSSWKEILSSMKTVIVWETDTVLEMKGLIDWSGIFNLATSTAVRVIKGKKWKGLIYCMQKQILTILHKNKKWTHESRKQITLTSDSACEAGWSSSISSHTSCCCETVWNWSTVSLLVVIPAQFFMLNGGRFSSLSLLKEICNYLSSFRVFPFSFIYTCTYNVRWNCLKLAPIFVFFSIIMATCPVQLNPK